MSDTIRAARITKTGALIPLHDGNEAILNRAGVEEVEAKRDEETGRLVAIGGADYVNLVSASASLPRIVDAIRENHAQRERLLTSALKLPNGEEFLMQENVYDGKQDRQYIDPESLQETIEVSEEVPEAEGVQDVTAELEKEAKSKKAAKKKPDPDLSEL